MPDRFDLVQAFKDLDEGTITPRTYLELHAHMIRDGSAWSARPPGSSRVATLPPPAR
jgi:hypothetical protein